MPLLASAKEKLDRTLDIREGEATIVWIAVAINLILLLSIKTFYTALMSFYTKQFDASTIPLMFLLANAFMIPISIVAVKLEERFTIRRILLPIMIFFVVGTLVLGGLIVSLPETQRWIYGIGFVWGEMMLRLMPVLFLSYLYTLLDIRQVKRLFSLIDSGRSFGNIALIVFVPVLISTVGIRYLPFVAGLLFLVQFALYPYLFLQEKHCELHDSAQALKQNPEPMNIQSFLKNRYLVLIGGFVGGWIFFSYFASQLLLSSLKNEYSAEDMATFLSIFYSTVFAIRLCLELFVTRLFLKQFGVMGGLLIQPVILFWCALASIFVPADWQVWTFVLFSACLLQLDAFYHSSVSLMYQPLNLRIRQRAQVYIRGVFARGASILTCLILLGLTWGLESEFSDLSIVLVLVGMLWIGCGLLLRKQYVNKLIASFKDQHGKADILDLKIYDRQGVRILLSMMESATNEKVLHAIQILDQQDLDQVDLGSFRYALVLCLERADPSVRIQALNVLSRKGTPEIAEYIWPHLKQSESVALLGMAIHTYCALKREESLLEVSPFLSHPISEIRATTIAGMCKYAGLQGVYESASALKLFLHSPEEEKKILVAEILEEVESATFFAPLASLLQDPSIAVRRAALMASCHVHHPKLVPLIIQHLKESPTQSYAIRALVAMGDMAIGVLGHTLRREARGNFQWEVGIIKTLSLIANAKAFAVLQEWFTEEQDLATQRVLVQEFIQHNIFFVQHLSQDRIHLLIDKVCQIYFQNLLYIDHLSAFEFTDRLQVALRSDSRAYVQFLLHLIYLLHRSKALLNAFPTLLEAQSSQRAKAMELVDNLLDAHLKRRIIPVLEVLPDKTKLERMHSAYSPPTLSLTEILEAIIHHDSPLDNWTKAVAIHTALLLVLPKKKPLPVEIAKLIPMIEHALAWSNNSVLREIALEALCHIQPSRQLPLAQQYSQDRDPSVRTYAKAMLQGKPMSLTLEKLLLLKNIELFAQASDEVLASVIQIAEEAIYRKGRTLFVVGNPADSLYIVLKGSVRIHLEKKEIAVLSPGQSIGEYAILDGSPRRVNATVVKDSVLLRIGRRELMVVLAQHFELVEVMFRVLLERLRHNLSPKLIMSDNEQDFLLQFLV